MEKIYTVRVGRTDYNSKAVTVMCEENEIEGIAIAIYRYLKEVQEFGPMPYALVYSEGETCTFRCPDVILLDCM